MRWLVGIVAALAFAPAAHAQDVTFQAVDPESWSPTSHTIRAGGTVTWTFQGTSGLHNVISDSPNWTYKSGDFQIGHPTVSRPFPDVGTFLFRCEVHPNMKGQVVVTGASGEPPPPPPPPPPSEQHWANDHRATTVFEVVDEVRPKLARLRAARVRNGARLRFRLSERAQVIVRFKRKGRVVRTARKTFGKGARAFVVRDRRMAGRYRIEAFARDLSGNRSNVRRSAVTIR